MYCALRGGADKTNLLNIKHFLNTSSYFKNHFTKSSRAIVNISIITSLALSQSLAAVNLPSGGKFVNGTGSITTNGNTMNITGDKTHNVIAWGGGFNIGKDNTVNFTTNSKSYLNLDYTNKASQILGTLNGGTNNVYIVNPSGVLVGEGATINANKFGASTTPMDMNAINTFSDNGSFSPVFESNKGDIVNLGSIKANEIVLVGNKVENIKGKLQGKDQTFADTVTIKGDKVYLEGVGINAINLDAKIGSEGYFRYDTGILHNVYINNGNKLGNYTFNDSATNGNFKKYLYIGNKYADNDQMINSWKGFAGLVNDGVFEDLGFDDVYLGKDIDFADAGAIDPVWWDESYSAGFAANFYGNNHTLSNIQINTNIQSYYAGLFGFITGGSFQDLKIDGLSFSNNSIYYVGGFAGLITNGTFSNISLNNIGDIEGEYVGGFVGYIGEGTFSNISLNNIRNIRAERVGGFVGQITNGTFSNIVLNNIKSIDSDYIAGGFAAEVIREAAFSNIVLNNIENINSEQRVGGFVSDIKDGTFSNISLNNIGNIHANYTVGGFVANVSNTADFSYVILNNIGNISSSSYAGGFVGTPGWWGDNFSYIILNNIGNISGDYAGGFAGDIKSTAKLSNIVLNNIGNITGTTEVGNFADSAPENSYSNIYFYGKNPSSNQNDNGVQYEETPLDLAKNDDLQTLQTNSGISGLEYLADTSTGNSYLHTKNNDGYIGNGDSKITFDKDNFTYNTSNIPEVNPDNPSSSSTVPNEGKLTSVTLEQNDFNKEILESILGGSSLEFDLLSGDLESIRQSLDFLTAFLKDDNTISDLFGYIPSDKYDSNVYNKFTGNLQADIEKAIQDKVLDLDFLKEYRASLEKYNNDKKLYESGLLHPEFQAALDKELEKQYANLLGLEDRVNSMLEIFGDYKLILDKDKKIFNKEGSNLKFKVGIGELVNYKNTEGGGENNNNFNPPSDLSKQTELSSKEPVFVLPVEETQNAIDEAKIELGRVCIVSDNAKTSNPCIAIAF
ncbi:filamentous hemagglutinin N-terminal domain-containing protein [Campylobacter coli]|nr:filamentous hemagglutinin N-terminal domain-containing protein [Campylobacter coli]